MPAWRQGESMNESMTRMTVGETASLREAIQAIDRGSAGFALVVDDRSRLKGIATDGDIRRAILGGHSLDEPIAGVMNREPVVATADCSESQILELMSDRIRFVPILDDGGRLADLASYEHVYRIPVAEPTLGEREIEYVTDCIKTGWVSSAGRYVREFERMMAEYCGVKHAIATSSGTTALHLALLALGVGPGDEVIVPDMTFIASANAVAYTGATPVLADVERETWTLDVAHAASLVTGKTKAVMPVHLFGVPARMDSVMELAGSHGIAVVEDAAEAHGAVCAGKKAGAIGDIGCFSFFGNKIVTTGEGGMITTGSDELAATCRMLRDHGMSRDERYFHPVLGYNYRLTNVQAAIGVAQMEKIESILERKRALVHVYKELLEGADSLVMPPEPEYGVPVNWMFSVLLSDSCPLSAREAGRLMSERNIEVRPFFVPLHRQPIYEGSGSGDYPVSEMLHDRGLSLPSSANLRERDVRRICEQLIAICSSGRGRPGPGEAIQ